VVAEVDLNVVATADGQLVEVQGGGETGPVEAERYVQLVAAGVTAVQDILKTVRPMLR
jgi:ribonuclease PH